MRFIVLMGSAVLVLAACSGAAPPLSELATPTAAQSSPTPALATPTPAPALDTPAPTPPPATPRPDPTPELEPSPPPSPLPTASPEAPAEGPLQVSWRERSLDNGLGSGVTISGSAVVGNRFVIIGERETSDDFLPAIWWSQDGIEWHLASMPMSQNFQTLSDVTSAGPGLVVVGSEHSEGNARPLVWLSSDGSSWEAVHDPDLDRGEARHVGATDAGLVAFGDEWQGGEDVPLVWTSADGRDWQPETGDAALEVASGVSVLVRSGAELTAFVQPAARRAPVGVWRTNGLAGWTKVTELTGSEGGYVATAAAGPRGWVAVGSSRRDRLAWTSADGTTWDLAPTVPLAESDIFADQAGFIAVGFHDPEGGCAISERSLIGQTWTSSDGRTWRQMPQDGWKGRWIDALRRLGRTLIGIGVSYQGQREAQGMVWTARLPAASAEAGPAPAQTPVPLPEGCG